MLQKISHHSPLANRFLIVTICVAFALTLIPILMISPYDRLSADDISYGWQTKQVFLQTGSLTETLSTALKVVINAYKTWQGTFSAIFLFTLQPAILGEEYYAVTPFIMLGMLMFSTLSMLRTLLREWRYVLITGSAMLFLSIQYLPSATEGFFWYNGAVFYTFFYSAFLFCFSGQLRLYSSNTGTDPFFLFKTLLYITLSFLIGGGNYVTALLQVIVIFTMTIFCFLFRKAIRLKIVFLFFMLSSLSGLALSLSAPGNAVRQRLFSQPSVPSAILSSFEQAFRDSLDWFTPPVFCMLILLTPLFYSIASSSTFRFRLPLVVLIASFCVFAAQNMPPIYAVGDPGPDRLRNIIYFSYIWMITGNVFYLTGWVSSRLKLRSHDVAVAAKNRTIKAASGRFSDYRTYVQFAVMLCTFVICMDAVWESAPVTTSYRCAFDLLQGTAKHRLREYNERLQILNDVNIMHAELIPFTATPTTIALPVDYKATDEASLNEAGARYYGKKSIVLKSEDMPLAHITRLNASGISINGKSVEMSLYRIGQGTSNYACIYDIARAFADSKPFDIHPDDKIGAIMLQSGQTYTSVRNTPVDAMDGMRAAKVNTRFFIDGIPADIRAYEIRNEIFVKLNDVAKVLDFAITYNRVTNMVELDTNNGFAGYNPIPLKLKESSHGLSMFRTIYVKTLEYEEQIY